MVPPRQEVPPFSREDWAPPWESLDAVAPVSGPTTVHRDEEKRTVDYPINGGTGTVEPNTGVCVHTVQRLIFPRWARSTSDYGSPF